MLSMLRKRLHNDEDGFTLIELMVVVLIIAILMAIAIPAFMGAQEKAKDRSAQSDLRNGITNIRTVATDNSGAVDALDTDALIAALTTAEPNIAFADAGSKDAVGVLVVAGNDTTTPPVLGSVTLWTQSESGTWFGQATDSSGTVYSCDGTAASAVSTYANCKQGGVEPSAT